MEWIGVVGIVAGLVFFVIAAMRGWNVLITSIVTAIIIALTNGMDIMNTMVGTETSYATGLAGFIRGNLMIFMGGAIMGEFMDKSGAAKAIAQAIMAKVGTKSPYFVLLGISAVGALLTYAGISMFVAMFALIPLARPMFRECNIPWHLFCAAWTLGACSFTMAMIPGVPAVAWINAANGCGVSLTAAPIMGIVGSIIAIAVSCVYIKFALKRAEAKGEHFVADADDVAVEEDKNIPSVGLALLPLIILIAVIIGLSATGMKNVVYIGMLAGIIASIACFFKYVPSVRDALGKGAVAGVGPAVFTSAAVGVGTVPPPRWASRLSTRPSSTCPAAPTCPLPRWPRPLAASWAPARARWASSPRTSSSRTWPRASIRRLWRRSSPRRPRSAARCPTPALCSACSPPWA